MEYDLETLNKSLVYVKAADTPDVMNVVVPELNPASLDLIDQVRLESYIRLKSLPLDVRRLVCSYVEASSIANQIGTAIPGLPVAKPTHYPNGAVELQWRFESLAVFGVILQGFRTILKENEEHSLVTERDGKIMWHFHSPKVRQQSGEFESVDELIEFMSKSISV